MCSPEPGKGGGGRGGGGAGGRGRGGGGGGGGGSSGGGGLSEFWSCLDPKQRDSLLTINGRAVRESLDCDLCRDLLHAATLALEEGGNQSMHTLDRSDSSDRSDGSLYRSLRSFPFSFFFHRICIIYIHLR